MEFFTLYFEFGIDLVALILGSILIFQKSDNHPKFYWGIIAALIGSVYIWENIDWVITRVQDPDHDYGELLNMDDMLKFIMLACVVSLYPIASLRPGYLNNFRVALYMFPPVITSTIGICYLAFNGHITPVFSIGDIEANIDKFDVKLRLIIFLVSIIVPLLYFLVPSLTNKSKRKINKMMYIFIGFIFTLLGIHILFTLFICDLLYNGFGIVAILFSIFFAIQYLRQESPLSHYEEASEEPETLEPVILPLFQAIDDYLKSNRNYTNDEYSLSDISKYFGEKETDVSQSIKIAGYSGFKEYINKLRLEHFRELIRQDPNRTTKELWIKCGFPSKATFYRLFALEYNEAPRDFIHKEKGNINDK